MQIYQHSGGYPIYQVPIRRQGFAIGMLIDPLTFEIVRDITFSMRRAEIDAWCSEQGIEPPCIWIDRERLSCVEFGACLLINGDTHVKWPVVNFIDERLAKMFEERFG